MSMNGPSNRPVGQKDTPLNPQWRVLPVAPWSLARLRSYINPMFPQGTIVALSNEILVGQATPTRYEGQGPQDLVVSTQVRIYKWCENTTAFNHTTPDGGKRANSIQEKHLFDPVTSQRAPRGGWPLGKQVKLHIADATSYTTARIYPKQSEDPRGVVIPVQTGIVGEVTKAMTATDRPRTKTQEMSSTREDWWYVLEVGVRKEKWEWVKCQSWIPVKELEPLHSRDRVAIEHDTQIRATKDRPARLTVMSSPVPRNTH
ncbi:hypothetical protein GSI_04480 [Ganoderma sinense ZZ0214-1]|uniref:Uncharacterized protein n=1 Tax=Ganoderma sinense ZZ0214-1 TaxID=1077348 RepID=A0A2G8SH03_9APHY|nr:hypothetical protein GSI_04480 [Ganoderma sinense ZZ0214-1]